MNMLLPRSQPVVNDPSVQDDIDVILDTVSTMEVLNGSLQLSVMQNETLAVCKSCHSTWHGKGGKLMLIK